MFDLTKVNYEMAQFLRNANVFTTTQRGVTTASATGTFAAETTLLINRTNVKNVRSVVVAAVTLVYGRDYDVYVNYDDSGTIKCRIVFGSAQTGAYTVSYDYGTDRIFSDYPRQDLTISSFPRIGFDTVDVPITPAGFGGVDRYEVNMSINVYDLTATAIKGYINTVRSAIFGAKTSFWYIGRYVHVVAIGPILNSPFEMGKDVVMQQNVDVRGEFTYEK